MELPRLSVVFLQADVAIHFILTVWASQCTWLPLSYPFCNFLVLGVGVAAVVASSNNELAELFLFGMGFALLQDIIVVAAFYKDEDKTFTACTKDHIRFSFVMSILNLLLKPFSIIVIFLNYIGRSDGGLKAKLATYRSSRGIASEPPIANEAIPPQQPPIY